MNSKVKIFIGLTEIAGYYSHLKTGFQNPGVDCFMAHIIGHPFEYDRGRDYLVLKIARYSRKRVNETRNSSVLLMCICALVYAACVTGLFLWAISKYDVFIFGFRSTFFFYLELPILKCLGKKIIYVFHGGDSRPVKALQLSDKPEIERLIMEFVYGG